MSRTAKKGITFYRVDTGHIRHRKIRLLLNEFDSDGYWIWSCILDKAYETNGYYFDLNDKDALELFATDDCKKKLNLVKEVIDGCLRRGLFDKSVHELFGILTCDFMQEVFIYATYERRKKGVEFSMVKDWLLIDQEKYNTVNLLILPGKKDQNQGHLPGKNVIPPGRNATNETETKRNGNKTENLAPAQPSPQKVSIEKKQAKEEVPEPYWQQLVDGWFDFHKAKGLDEPTFTGRNPKFFKEIILLLKKRAAKKSMEWTCENAVKILKYFLALAYSEDWLSKHFLLKNLLEQFDSIYQRAALEEKQKSQTGKGVDHSKPKGFQADIDYLYGRYCEGQLDRNIIPPEYYDKLVTHNFLKVGLLKADLLKADGDIDQQKIDGVINFLKSKQQQNGKLPAQVEG